MFKPEEHPFRISALGKSQDKGQKIVTFEDKIRGAFNIKVIKLSKFTLQLIKFSIKIYRFWHFEIANDIFLPKNIQNMAKK